MANRIALIFDTMEIFLKARHWQLFLAYCVPIIGPAITPRAIMFGQLDAGDVVYFLLAGVSYFTLLAWLWSVATRLRRFEMVEGQGLFQIIFFAVITYFVICTGLLLLGFANVQSFMIPHLVATIAIFYCVLFVARRLKALELGRRDIANDYINFFFLIAILPIGIWFLQPVVNRVYEKSSFT
jgi:hypothetical protein